MMLLYLTLNFYILAAIFRVKLVPQNGSLEDSATSELNTQCEINENTSEKVKSQTHKLTISK